MADEAADSEQSEKKQVEVMPELPDVEAFRDVLVSCAQGRVIGRVDVYDTGVLRGVSVRRLRGALEGRAFGTSRRHGKWLVVRIGAEREQGGGPVLLLHFGMTGELLCRTTGEALHAHDRVVFAVGSGRGPGRQLRYRDQRKLKGLWLADDTAAADRMLAGQGPDAAALTREEFDAALARRRGGLKSALTDQSVVAGLGNLLADEILWRARLGPEARVRELSGAQRARLHGELRRTVRAAQRAGRVPTAAGWLTGRRDVAGARCPRCGEVVRRGRVAGRGTVWCEVCQGPG